MTEVMLQLTAITKTYGHGAHAVTALSGVDLTVDAYELVAVMGASGSGKSSLLLIAGGLMEPSSGAVTVGGTPLAALRPNAVAALRRRSIGYVFQDYNLLPSLTVLENAILPLELDGWPVKRARAAGLAALASVDLAGLARSFPDELSGGQRQRVAIARAVVGDRRLILADEPTGALDSTASENVMRMLRQRIDAGAGGIIVTHDPRQAAWADRIIELRDGQIAHESARDQPDSILPSGTR